mgnify:CR=1 FL=1
MSSVLSCASNVLMKKRQKGESLSPEKKQKVYEKITRLAKDWQLGARYSNARDAKYNTFEQFERIYEEATGLPIDPVKSAIPNLKDLKKFEIRLNEFNAILSQRDGAIMANLKLPRRILKRLPETAKFGDELVAETGFFRRENVDNNKRINDILYNFKKFSGALGGDPKEYSNLEAMLEPILANKKAGRKYDNNLYKELRNKKMNMLTRGAGRANLILSEVFQGTSISDLRKNYGFGSAEESLLNNMKREYGEIRRSTSVNLIRGLQKIININKDSNVPGMDKILSDMKNRIKEIEFQQVRDEDGTPIKNLDFFKADKEMQVFGFKEDSRYAIKEGNTFKVANRQYMPQYVLGIPKILAKIERAVRKEPVEGETLESLMKSIKDEVQSLDGIIDRAKKRSVADSEYSVDPFMFLNKYVSDVSLFNYKVHVKDSFKRLTDTMLNEHLKPAKLAKNEIVTESLEHHLRVASDVYNTVQKLDAGDTVISDNIMRTISALTYFRLLGGNVRSAFRNGTQRIYEFNRWGYKGLKEAKRFYTDAGGTENAVLANQQAKKFGILWFDGKDIGSTVLDAWKGKGDISAASRGALQESFFTGKNLKVNADGEIVRSTDGVTDIIARGVSKVADKASVAHKVVEDWNRSRTFRTGFAVALRNLRNMSPEWISRKSGIKADNQEKLNKWMENEAGQIAYNTVLDLHYEYANWAKAKALQGKKGIAGRTGQILGQFMHYRFSNFDMMANWIDKGWTSIKAGDFTSDEVFTVMRLGITQAIINNIFAPATNIRTDSVLNNDVAQTLDTAYTWFSTDRDDPEQVKKLERKTFGQGGYYFLGPNIGFILSLAEVKDFHEMDEDIGYRDDAEFVDDRTKKYKTLSLINSQLARTWMYSAPLFYERGLIDAARLELGLFPDQEIRDIRDSAKKWVGRNLYPTFKADWMKYKRPKRKRSAQNTDSALQALSLLG